MKKRFKIFAAIITACIIFTAVMPIYQVAASRPGDVLGNVLNTNIRVFINGVEIMGYNINRDTYVIAEDLRAYGLSVRWKSTDRTLSITRGESTAEPKPVPLNSAREGSVAFQYVYTDIITRVDGREITSYNIRGSTVVKIDDIAAAFGEIIWDSQNRILSATLRTPETQPTAAPTIAPDEQSDIVYWVDNGAVYHSTSSCRSLSRSANIRSGTIAQSGKSRGCNICVG